MTIAKVQHYVPQFLMRNFGNGKKDQVWVYDKSSNRSFPSNTKNLASENRFYDFEYQGQSLSIEPWLSELEGHAKLVISTILDADSLSSLTDEQKHILASFLAVQLTRTKTFREEWNAFPRMVRDHFEQNGDQIAPGSQAEELLRDIPESDSKEQTARIVFSAPSIYADHFLAKDWVLAATSRQHPFLLSDNPLTRQNMIDRALRGNLGLTTPGIEIYLPLSPTRALAMWCPTLADLVHLGARSLVATRRAEDRADPEGIVAMSDSLLSGEPVQYSVANVENFNSLQIAWSERYIFSTSNDFNLAQTMLAEYPNLRQGPRSTVA
ncbi:hypothetical protein [Pseudomonas sp. 28 E 9]|uniref:DUF4238 domain-containing protein n=1 Tax=Pseudomonas sp. 28 E 9 TaxID=1844098 RepID=UPI000811FD4A|nr:DUF4238 domain-containing protein [Pseudomonas sp. 28 E 9]CRM58962.1 hypothetical protein [Pseudomonas sp. 28 E 9]